MAPANFFGFIAIVLAGGAVLALTLQWLNTESRDAREARRSMVVEPAVRSAAALSAFFAKPRAHASPPIVTGFDDALLAFLENHVRAEQAMVTKFVRFPSVDSLYRQARPPLPMN